MRDLARRLNERADRLDAGDLTDLSGALEREAAAEIERLRAANKVLAEAAGPFAKWARHELEHVLPANILADDGTPVMGDVWASKPEVTVGDLRAITRAVEAAALRAEAGETE